MIRCGNENDSHVAKALAIYFATVQQRGLYLMDVDDGVRPRFT